MSGDGRAISGLEGRFNGKRWEMQLKGAGPTPYCRGGDGRAVLRSSVREFLAQEHMHAMGVLTSRSLSLYASGTDSLVRELQAVMTRPYAEQDEATASKYYALKPASFFGMGGVSHMSCSS